LPPSGFGVSAQPGFFLAYERMSVDWEYRILEAMGFGLVFRSWKATLQMGDSATFLLYNISSVFAILFSIHQGTPWPSPSS
jgi:hypothetical protein